MWKLISRMLGFGQDEAEQKENIQDKQDDLSYKELKKEKGRAPKNDEKMRQKEKKSLQTGTKVGPSLEQKEPGVAPQSHSLEEPEAHVKPTKVCRKRRCSAEVLTTSQNNSLWSHELSEEDPEWDMNSAFVASVLRQNKMKKLRIESRPNSITKLSNKSSSLQPKLRLNEEQRKLLVEKLNTMSASRRRPLR